MSDSPWTIVVHGGAGAMRTMSAEKEAAYRSGLAEATRRGAEVLEDGGEALAAAIASVRFMEACGDFNAGHGSCLTKDGLIEVDAAVMDGADRSVGAVAAVPHLANGVTLADCIRRRSPHVLFAGQDAVRVADDWSDFEAETAEPREDRKRRWRRQMAEHDVSTLNPEDLTRLGGTHDEGDTVGAVALDQNGGLAVAVSTGGIWLKAPGRVGDSPIPGAGFWAEDGLVACCATGTGEFIMRAGLCFDVRARCQQGVAADVAAREALEAMSQAFGSGKAGLIAIDGQGRFSAPFDTAGMGRAWMRSGETNPTVRVWPEED